MPRMKEQLQIGELALNNRLVFPPIGTGKANVDGSVSEELIKHYNGISEGGYVSLIVVEHSFIAQQGKAGNRQLSVADDKMIEGLQKLTNVIHKNGSKTILQLNHAGAATHKSITGQDIVSSSELVNGNRETAHSMSHLEIKTLVQQFADAAQRAKTAGFDGVELHSAHSYLLNQFYSPYFNHRTDEYGKDIYGRIKLHLEIVHAIQGMVGTDYPLFIRLGACDYIDGGSTLEDSLTAAKKFEKAGVDALDISGGVYGFQVPGREQVPGYFARETTALKKAVSIPIILTGGITDIHAAEKLLEENAADLIGVGRALLRDPLWAKKSMGPE